MGAAFQVDGPSFVAFGRRLGRSDVRSPAGGPLDPGEIVDFDLCYAYNFEDPWGNRFELNCYDRGVVERELIEPLEIEPVRYW